LVENALACSARSDVVSVRAVRAEAGSCLITVSDQGTGMSTEQLRGLETYVPARRHRLEPGMGLGLAIVRRIVIRAGGEISFESRLEKGTTVRVRLPSK
jgi:signal transduction histidine kinase